MKLIDLFETASTPSIVVDVQPAYTGINDGDEISWINDMMDFLNKQKGPILLLMNGEDLTSDSISAVQEYWDDSGFDNWDNVTIIDKGYGYLRPWMDGGVQPDVIIKVIRLMYSKKVSDSRDIDDQILIDMGVDEELLDDAISVNWLSVAELKKHSGYIMGGGRDECLREVEILMNAFNIKYKEIQDYIY